MRLGLEKEFEENFKIERRKFKKKLESVNSEKEQVFGEVKSLVKRLEAEISTLKKEKVDLKNILVRLRCENLQILDQKKPDVGRAQRIPDSRPGQTEHIDLWKGDQGRLDQ